MEARVTIPFIILQAVGTIIKILCKEKKNMKYPLLMRQTSG